eukprot:scaffold42261_cov33-Phaeocystis_antarctica.AAC.1
MDAAWGGGTGRAPGYPTPGLTGLVPLESPLGRGVFSRASFAIQPKPRMRTHLDGAEALDPELCGMWCDESWARSGHPCDETAVAVLLGTPKLSPPPCSLAREISAATAP